MVRSVNKKKIKEKIIYCKIQNLGDSGYFLYFVIGLYPFFIQVSKCFYRVITFVPQYLYCYKIIFQSRNLLNYNRCADFDNLHEVSKKETCEGYNKIWS